MPEPVALPAPDHAAQKRLAMQIAVQLPTDHSSALAVISYLKDIADWEAGLVKPERVNREDDRAVLAFSRPA